MSIAHIHLSSAFFNRTAPSSSFLSALIPPDIDIVFGMDNASVHVIFDTQKCSPFKKILLLIMETMPYPRATPISSTLSSHPHCGMPKLKHS